MPHIHIEKFNFISLPAQKDDISFKFIATNIDHTNEHLIATKADNKNFFLQINESESKNLLKSDKISRPSSTYIIKKALLTYAKESELKILHSNINKNEQNMHLVEDSALKSIHYFIENFPQDREVRIEVGFGSGRHLLHQAKKNLDILYVGIEIHKPSIEQVIKQINIQKLDNILLLNYDARLFLELVPSNIISRIYVHFPVPWDKKQHRRVISQAFIKESIRVLISDGKLELRTDSDNYFKYSFETFISLNKINIEIFKNREIAISSKYEDRWRREEKNIYDIIMTNDINSPELEEITQFDFSIKELDEKKIYMLNGTTHRFQNSFIHFERLYKTSDNGYLFRLSMGNFEHPEHLYLLINRDKASYFPSEPLKSRSNYQVHTALNGLIYG